MSRPLNILLFAYGHAGVRALQGLRGAGHRITGCYTHPLAHSWEGSVRQACEAAQIPCSLDPADGAVVTSMTDRPDLVLSVFYRRRIEMPFLALGTIGAFNVAASQLPRYRGFFPTQWAILNNETMWGVTVHQMTPHLCDGAALHRKPVIVRPGENAYEFHMRCGEVAANAAIEAVARLAGGDEHLTSVESAAPFFAAGTPFGGAIDWQQPAGKLDAFIRALDFGRYVRSGYEHLKPPAAAAINAQPLGIWRSRFGGTMSVYPPGTITRCDEQVWVQCGRGHLVIEKVFAEGADHDAAGYFARRRIGAGAAFDSTHTWAALQGAEEYRHAA